MASSVRVLAVVLLLTPGPVAAQDILSGAERIREDSAAEDEDREERAEDEAGGDRDRGEEADRGSWLGRNWPILAAIGVVVLIAIAFAATSGTDDPGEPVLRFIPGGE